ncbi:helix-turn-helix domain-containing protein [Nocardia niwae]|uniref:helix-turn-helix domain-containing protein n=1 Tax=Nocardia niwae TaxID=626084 RepID=UPI0007A4EBD6|nr:helix-turn-helix domain-containing protein [Nocardia niwae]
MGVRQPSAGWDFAGPVAVMPGVSMIGYRDMGDALIDLQVAATTAVAILIEFGGRDLIVDDAHGRQVLGSFVVGLRMAAARVRGRGPACVEVRLSPARVNALFGVAPKALGGGIVAAEDLWGARVRRLREELAQAENWEQRFSLANSFLAQQYKPRHTPDPEVNAAWLHLLACGGQVRVDALAETVGWSRKRLWARFETQIGLTPKRAAMLVRFRCAVEGLVAGLPAAEVAAICGYTDQAHLCRDVAIFADRTPGALQPDKLPALALDRHRAWGTFFQASTRSTGR